MKKSFPSALLLVFAILISSSAFGQPRPPDPDVPITGIEILLALGGTLGLRKFLKARRIK